jgi:multidrug resistance efflux pump
MADNAAAERVVRRFEKDKQKANAMEEHAKEGLRLAFKSLQRRAEMVKEIQSARDTSDDAAYQEWLRKYDERHGDVGPEFTGFQEDRPWERD